MSESTATALEGTDDSTAIEDKKQLKKIQTTQLEPQRAHVQVSSKVKKQERKKEKGRFSMLEEQTKIDSKYKSEKFDLLESIIIYS